jgi:hypothetical protein
MANDSPLLPKANSDEGDKSSYAPLVIVVLSVFAMWAGSGLLIWTFIGKFDHRGQFGDMFGAVNALFSGLAFSGIIFTIILQRRELELQRLELRQTREVLLSQEAQLRIQNEWNKRQVFEASYYNLLKAHQDNVKDVFIAGADLSGRYAFAELIKRFNGSFKNHLINLSREELESNTPSREIFIDELQLIFRYMNGRVHGSHQNAINAIKDRVNIAADLLPHMPSLRALPGWIRLAYGFDVPETKEKIWKKQWDSLGDQAKLGVVNKVSSDIFHEFGMVTGPYFKFLFNILNFVDGSDLNTQDKGFFVGVLKSHLSHPEIALLFYTAISDNGSIKLMDIIKEYRLLDEIYPADLIVNESRQILWNARLQSHTVDAEDT